MKQTYSKNAATVSAFATHWHSFEVPVRVHLCACAYFHSLHEPDLLYPIYSVSKSRCDRLMSGANHLSPLVNGGQYCSLVNRG